MGDQLNPSGRLDRAVYTLIGHAFRLHVALPPVGSHAVGVLEYGQD